MTNDSIPSPFQALYNAAAPKPVVSTVSTPQTPVASNSGQNTPSSQPIQMGDGTQIDPSVVALMHGLKQNESPNGDYNAIGDQGTAAGIGQWSNEVNGKPQKLAPGQIPANFQNWAKDYGLNPNDFSPENQNKLMYAVLAKDKADGLTPEQSLSKWNSGDPNKYLNAATSTGNGPVGAYNVASYVQKGMAAAQQYAQQNRQTQIGANQPAPEVTPSVGGFAENVVKSGANFLGNIGNAVLHPIQTVQNIGGAAVGGLQELGGQQNDNTQKFDALKNYFVQRYGSVDNLLHTAYIDPIGLAGDVSAALGVGGGLVGAVGKVGELAGASDAADIAGSVASGLGKASKMTNPLTPVIAGAGKILSSSGVVSSELGSQVTGFEPATIDKIIQSPESFTSDQIANSSRITVAQQVEKALNDKEAALSETGSGYAAFKEGLTGTTGVAAQGKDAIPVSQNFLEDQLRSVAKVDVQDGNIVANGSSGIRAPKDIRALQSLMDTWKPEFQKGYLTPEEFLNFRQDLAGAAKLEGEFSASKPVESIAAGIRSNLNSEYRSAVPGLEELDASYSSQLEELKTLRKGILDKGDNLQDSAINKIANAGGKGKDLQLAKLEQLVPGISKKLEVLKAIEDIQKAGGTKVGTYPSAFLKAGGVMMGLATGNLPLVATAAATMIIASPGIAVPLLRMLGGGEPFAKLVMGHLAKFATISATSFAATNSAPQTIPTDQTAQETAPQTDNTTQGTQSQNQLDSGVPSSLIQLASSKGFDLQKALAAGYSSQEIQQYLTAQ